MGTQWNFFTEIFLKLKLKGELEQRVCFSLCLVMIFMHFERCVCEREPDLHKRSDCPDARS